MGRTKPPDGPLEWSDEWYSAPSFDVCSDLHGRYEIRRVRDVAGVNVASLHLGRRVYIAQTLDPRRFEFESLYCGFHLDRAKRRCELHRLRQLSTKRRPIRRNTRGNRFQLN
jgi:hypothetical protein